MGSSHKGAAPVACNLVVLVMQTVVLGVAYRTLGFGGVAMAAFHGAIGKYRGVHRMRPFGDYCHLLRYRCGPLTHVRAEYRIGRASRTRFGASLH